SLDRPRVDPAVIALHRDAVIDGPALPIGQVVHPHQLPLQGVADGDDALGTVGAVPFVVTNPRRGAAMELVAATPVFSGVHRQHRPVVGATLFDPHHRV